MIGKVSRSYAHLGGGMPLLYTPGLKGINKRLPNPFVEPHFLVRKLQQIIQQPEVMQASRIDG